MKVIGESVLSYYDYGDYLMKAGNPPILLESFLKSKCETTYFNYVSSIGWHLYHEEQGEKEV